ncbi:hypothetical protein PIROE2DRAFT_17291 [Piromyces sp. E2]|nr:hypothetical protein PIROE2DRAFT_17291 [Piromyces sp. E2]|eukprot:OUM57654.1 hypothetical protein PIROE2DRAFT_17291 [Piromyces sp. E2]
MYNGNISQSLDRNHSLSLFYSRRTPSKAKPPKKQSKFILPSGENLSPVKINTTTPYNSTTTPILVHSLSDMSLKNNTDRLEPDDSPTPAGRYSKIVTSTSKQNNMNGMEKPLPLYPNTIPQKLSVKSNSTSKIEGNQNMLTLPKFQRRSARMAVVMSERKPVNLFTNMSQEEKDDLDDTPLGSKNGGSYNEKNQMNLDEQNTDLDDCPCSEGFLNSDGIWEDPTLSQSESRCLQTPTVGNIMTTNEEYESQKDQNTNNDKTLMWDFEDENKFNDKENIIPDDYKGGVLAEREWCDLGNDEDSMMEEYDNNDYLGSSSQNKSLPKSLQKGKKQSNSMIRKSEYQHVRYAFQEISVNSMPEYQMNSMDCYSVYSNSSFGSACDSQFMATPKKCSGSYKMNNSFSNSFTNDNIDNNDSIPSFFNTLPLKNMKMGASTSTSTNSKKSTYTKRLVYQLCGVPDMNAIHKRSQPKSKGTNNGDKGDNPSFMNSSPIISKTSILSPPFLLSSPVVRNGFSSPLVQSKSNYTFNPPRSKKPFLGDDHDNDPFAKKDTNDAAVPPNSLDEKTPKPRKVKSLLTTSINNSLSSSDDANSPTPLHNSSQILEGKTTPKPISSDNGQRNEKEEETVFFPHYHSRQHSQADDEKVTASIVPSMNLSKRGRISAEDKKKEFINRRRLRIKKYGF